MASKSAKRARVDASSSKDCSAAISPPSPPMTAANGADPQTDAGFDEDIVTKLRVELETATKCIEQLRREKDYEVRQAREEEQNRSSTAMKELECRLKTDCRRDVEKAREVIKSRLEADATRLAGRYERTIKRLSNDLDRCRNELREEIEKRGMSSTTRGGFETERCRLLAEVRDLKAAKRRLEETVESHVEADKQKTAELKRTQEACKAEVAKVSKEANAEIRKLLEELKARDHQLALLDRNQYPDRGTSLPKQQQQQPNESQPKETDSTALRPVKPVITDEVVSSDTNQAEITSNLKKEVEKLKSQLTASEADRAAMKVRVDELNRDLVQRNELIAKLQKVDRSASEAKPTSLKNPPKSVRFLLPGCTSPVLAREVEPVFYGDDDNESISSEMSCGSVSSTSSVLSQDTNVLYDENIVKNYHILLSEHLNLQRSISLLLSSWTSPSAPAATSSSSSSSTQCPSLATNAIKETTSTCQRQECVVEKEAMKVAVEALEKKRSHYEEDVYQLQHQLKEQSEINEELEFRVFELEECVEKCKLTHTSNAAEDLLEKMRFLEGELMSLNERLTYYKKIESDVVQPTGLGLKEYIDIVSRRLADAENQSTMSRLEVMALRKQLEEAVQCQLEESTEGQSKRLVLTRLDEDEVMAAATSDTRDIIGDIDDLSACAMNSSMSTTSGFDDDDSCASSVADEMPLEETWGFDDDGAGVNADAEPVAVSMSNERQGQKKLVRQQQQQQPPPPVQAFGDDVSLEAVRLSDEELWVSRFEKLEVRLALAIQNEQRARDQAALLGEEKDRRIAALQEQVDLLEANEFRVSETIRSLERLERTFNRHVIGSENCKAISSPDSPADATTQIDAHIATNGFSRVVADDEAQSAMRDLCAATASENRMQCEASAMLRTSIEKLRLTEAESEAVDKRIKDLSNAADGPSTTVDCVNLGEISAVGSNNGWDNPVVDVDLESEYRELETLVRELKRVLIVDNDGGKRTPCVDGNGNDVDSNRCVPSTLAVEAGNSWEAGSACYSIPASPMYEIPSSMGLMTERSEEFDNIERCLTNQIRSLEQERDVLRDAVCDGEATMHELSIKLVELQSSENSLRDEVGRLKAKEEWMISRNDELMELVGRLEESVNSHRAAEIELRSRAERHCASETERGRELDDARDELRAVETRYRRWVAQLDDEKVQLRAIVDDLTDKNADLEGREAGLLCRIKKLEATEFGLRSEVADLERALIETTEDRERLMTQISNKEMKPTATSSAADGWSQCDNDDYVNDCEQRCRHLAERTEFFKEMLEFTELSYAALEARFVERSAAEETLKSAVAEREKVEKTLVERVTSLEAEKEHMATRIAELEAQIQYNHHHHQQQQRQQQLGKETILANEAGFGNDSDFMKQLQQQANSAFQGIMLLSDVADKLDDSEMILWTAVENARIGGDGITETHLTSSFWCDVEKRMGLNLNDAPSQFDDHQRVLPAAATLSQQPSDTDNSSEAQRRPVDGANQQQQQQQQQQPTSNPPPLPLSPPPPSPISDSGPEYFFSDRQQPNGEAVSPSGRWAPHVPQQRSHSADPLSPRSAATSGGQRWKRASSESREAEVAPKLAIFSQDQTKTNYATQQPAENASSRPTDGAAAAVRDPITERISRSREFWSARSMSMPGQQPPSPGASTGHQSSSNGRPSLIPRIALPLRTPPVQRSVSEFGGPKAGWLPAASTTMPVIRSTPSPHLSPISSSSELDDKRSNGKSYIPRPINDCRTSGFDNESTDNQTIAKQTVVTPGRPGHRDTSKTYTAVMSPNRYVTSKSSHLSSSSLNPLTVRTSNADSKMNPASSPSSSYLTATTQLTLRPVVSSTASSPEVFQLPGSRA